MNLCLILDIRYGHTLGACKLLTYALQLGL